MVKFKLGFTIDAKTLFGILSQFLPVEDLSVEEVVARAPDPTIRFDKRFDLPKPARAPQVRKKRGSGYEINLHAGANAIIMGVLADGAPHLGREMFSGMEAARYSTNGLYGRLTRLKYHGYVERAGNAKWRITHKGKLAWAAQPPAPAEESAA